MQTNLDFKSEAITDKQEDNICLPEELDPCYFSPTNQLLGDLEDFNSKYKTNLCVQNAGKWAVGTYDLVKEIASKMMFPTWETKNGANAIHKFKRYSTWSYDKCIDDLKLLDSKLYEVRRAGIKLFSENSVEEGQSWIDKFNKKILKSLKSIEAHVEYTNIPYFDTGRKVFQLYPIIYDADCVIEDYIGHIFDGPESEDKPTGYFPYEHMEKPTSWYFNILIPLRNVEINLSKRGESLYKIPYGDLVVGFSIPVDAIYKLSLLGNNIRAFQNKFSIISNNIGQFTYKFPIRRSVQHPFVSARDYTQNEITSSDFRLYDLGNTCFGDFKQEIYQHLVMGNLSIAKSVLDTWSSNFIINGTSPLNQTSSFIFGTNDRLKEIGVVVDNALCERELHNSSGGFKEEFKAEYCTSCTLTKQCVSWQRMNAADIKFEFDDDELGILGEWVPIYIYIMKYCRASRSDVREAFNCLHMGFADMSPRECRLMMDPSEWAGSLYGEGHKHEGHLLIETFMYQLVPMMERIYAFSLLSDINVAARDRQREIAKTEPDKKKSNHELFKLYNNLLLSIGRTYQVKPDIAFITYCKSSHSYE